VREVPKRVRSIVSFIESGQLTGESKDAQPSLDGRQTTNSEEENREERADAPEPPKDWQSITGWVVRDDDQNPAHEVFREWRNESLSNSEEVDIGLNAAPLLADHEDIQMEESTEDQTGQEAEMSVQAGDGDEEEEAAAVSTPHSPESSSSTWSSN
jgi:hypothetical protein